MSVSQHFTHHYRCTDTIVMSRKLQHNKLYSKSRRLATDQPVSKYKPHTAAATQMSNTPNQTPRTREKKQKKTCGHTTSQRTPTHQLREPPPSTHQQHSLLKQHPRRRQPIIYPPTRQPNSQTHKLTNGKTEKRTSGRTSDRPADQVNPPTDQPTNGTYLPAHGTLGRSPCLACGSRRG